MVTGTLSSCCLYADVGTTLPKPRQEETQHILCSPAAPHIVKAQQPTPGKACQKLAFFSPTQLLRPRQSQRKVPILFHGMLSKPV